MILEIILLVVMFLTLIGSFLLVVKTEDNSWWWLNMFTVVIFLFFLSNSNQITPTYFSQPIVSLERDNQVSGSFFLGSGVIDSRQIYYFYTITNQGYLLKNSASYPKDCGYEPLYLVEDDSQAPQIICENKCTGKKPSFFNWNLDYSCEHYNRLIVPKGTVIKEFKA